MSENRTHWRKFHETDFLGAHDLQGIGKSEIILQIKSAQGAVVKDQNGSSSNCLTIHFEGGSKPMIVNATNAKALEKVAGSAFIEDWAGCYVTIYIKKGVKAFGAVVDALRIKDRAPRISKPDFTQDIKNLQGCLNMDQLKHIWSGLSVQAKNNAEVLKVKEELKKKLS